MTSIVKAVAHRGLERLFGHISALAETPGDILVQMEMTDQAFHLVLGTPHITGFVGGKNPAPISDAEAATMLTGQAAEAGPGAPPSFQPGAQVRITEGPFANFVAVIDSVNAEASTLNVRVEIFGRVTPVEVGFAQVSAL